jgi:hypothetical protein
VFGSKTGRLSRAAQQMKKKGKDLPQFSAEGQIAPARQRELETQMREMIPLMGAKDPAKVAADLDAWVKSNPFWGKYPLQKEPLLDLMPASLRAPLYQSLKNMGYGGVKMGSREFGSRRPDYRPGKETITPGADRKWEDILKYEQGGGIPAGWAVRNPGAAPKWVARPGESLQPGQEALLADLLKKGATGAAALEGIASLADNPDADADQAAVPGSKKLLRKIQLARSGRLLDPPKQGPTPGAVSAPEALKVSRFENLADILPSRLQRRGLYYTLASNPTTPFNMKLPSGSYQNNFSSILKPGSEGGSQGVLGMMAPKNPLRLQGSSFYGLESPRILGGKITSAKSWEELNKVLPKKYRLTNNEIRNFKSDPYRSYSFNDTVGDLLLAKYMKKEGIDAGIGNSLWKEAAKGRLRKSKWPSDWSREAIFPSESRWDSSPAFTSNAATLMEYAKSGPSLPPEATLSLLKKGVPVAPEVQSAAKATKSSTPSPKKTSYLDEPPAAWDDVDLGDLISGLKKSSSDKKKMTKEERIAKWGNPGVKSATGAINFSSPDDYLSYRLPNNSFLTGPTYDNFLGAPLTQKFDSVKNLKSGKPVISPFLEDPNELLKYLKKGVPPYGKAVTVDTKKYPTKPEVLDELKKLVNVVDADIAF